MLVSALALGLATGLLGGGHLRNLTRVRIRGFWFLIIGAAIRLAGAVLALPTLPYVVALACFAAVAFMNRAFPGASMVGVGIVANLAVVAANGGMPVSADALGLAGASMPRDGLHVALSDQTLLPFLGDVIPLAAVRAVYSPGDFVLAAGGFWLTLRAVRTT